jgi:hypothetical protein
LIKGAYAPFNFILLNPGGAISASAASEPHTRQPKLKMLLLIFQKKYVIIYVQGKERI